MTDAELLRGLETKLTEEAKVVYRVLKSRIWAIVKGEVRRGDSAGLLSRLRASLEEFQDRWRDLLESRHETSQAIRLHALIVCGQLAVIGRGGSPASTREALERVLSGAISLRERVSDEMLAVAHIQDESTWRQFIVDVATTVGWRSPVNDGWIDDTLHALWDQPRPVRTTRRVAVAGVRRPGGIAAGEGFLTLLVLDILPGGRGRVYQAPEDASRTATDKDFDRAMENAWLSAGASVKAHLAECKVPYDSQRHAIGTFDGRWRLIGEWDALPGNWWEGAASDPLFEAKDNSASAAAARGWLHALAETYPDNGVIVLGAVASAEGALAEVGGVTQKVEAILAHNAARRAAKLEVFDTVVLVGDTNHEASNILGTPMTHKGLLVFRLSET